MVIKENKYLTFDIPKQINFKFFIKYLLSIMYRMFYGILFLFIRVPRNNFKYNVSICAIFKDEADYLKEWIEFHRIVGVEHFYLYNNKSTDNYLEVLSPYIRMGIVSLIDWPKPQGQLSAYKNFMETKRNETRWVGLIDIDEFVVPNSTESIYDFLQQFNNKPAVIVYWKIFGTSGKIKRDVSNLITEEFIVSWKKYANIGKIFFNTNFAYDTKLKENGATMHYLWSKWKNIKVPPVNVFGKTCMYGHSPVSSDLMPLQINHYLVKSYDEYIHKKSKRGGGVHPIGMHDMSYFFEHEMKCNSVDYHAYKYLVKLKLAMEKK